MTADSSARRRPGRKLVVVAMGVVALMAVAAVAIFPSRPESSTPPGLSSTTTSTVSDAGAVDSLLADHVQLLSARAISNLAEQYASNATVSWTGQAGELTGTYSGASNISILFASFIGKFVSCSLTNVTEGAVEISGDLATVNSSFDLIGRSSYFGNVSAMVSARDSLVRSALNGTWLISQEVWDFLSLNEQYPLGAPSRPIPPPVPQTVDALSLSADGNYLAAGTITKAGPSNGSVYSIPLGSQDPSWRYATNNTAIDSVAVSANGSYVAAGGYRDAYDGGEIYLFSQGTMLWNVSTGSLPVFQVAISANGSRIAADYERGVLCLNTAGQVLWNFTFPGSGGWSDQISMTSNGSSVVVGAEDLLLGNWTNFGWGLFYLDSQGHQVWNYTEDNAGVSFVQMSSDGSSVVAASFYAYAAHSGGLYYFNGSTGALLWRSQASTAVQPLLSPDGAYVAAAGNGVQLFNSAGNLLWNFTDLGPPIAFLQNESLVIFGDGPPDGVNLVGYSGTILASFDVQGQVAVSANGQTWAVVLGPINPGSCATVRILDGLIALPTEYLCL